MKRIIFSVFLIFMAKSLFANVNIGGTVGAVHYDELHLQYSLGWTVGVDLFYGFSMYYNGFKGEFSDSKLDSGGSVISERKYEHFVHMGKVQYLYPLSSYRLHLGGSVGFGVGEFSIYRKDESTSIESEEKEKLSLYGLWADGKFDIDQKFSITASLGYLKASSSGKLADKSVQGPDFKIGITYALIGKNKKLY